MNVVDIIILVILGCGLLSGLYRGFIHSVLNLGSGILAFVASFLLYPKLADVVSGNPEIIRMISSFTDSESLLGDLDLDGDVDAYDLTALARHVGGIEEVTDAVALANADVTGDGRINANDLTKHARFVGGIITSWDQE